MNKLKLFFTSKKHWLRKKRFWAITILVLIVLYLILKPKTIDPNTIITDTVHRQDLKETVLATGQVTSTTDLTLSFNSSGVVKSVRATVGERVKTGTILATLDQGSAYGALAQARGSLLAAEARLRKLQEGATSTEIRVSELALENALVDLAETKNQQALLIENARRAYLNSSLAAIGAAMNPSNSTTAPLITGTYTGKNETVYTIQVSPNSNGGLWSARATNGVLGGSGFLSTTVPQPFGVDGLFIQFPSGFNTTATSEWVVSLPNTQASTYLANYNAYLTAQQTATTTISSAQNAVASAQAALDLKKAAARTSDIDLAEADIVSAQGGVASATAVYENSLIRAPAAGTITRVDVHLGDLVSPGKAAIVLQDIGNLYLEANINEANISNVKIGQPVSFTLDAFGSDKNFSGHVSAIDLSPTLVSGVVNYKITAAIDPADGIKPGLTANMTVEIAQKKDVLVIPSRAIVTHADDPARQDKKYVRVVTNPKSKKFIEQEVTTGMEGDAGLIEVTSGLAADQEIVVYIQTK